MTRLSIRIEERRYKLELKDIKRERLRKERIKRQMQNVKEMKEIEARKAAQLYDTELDKIANQESEHFLTHRDSFTLNIKRVPQSYVANRTKATSTFNLNKFHSALEKLYRDYGNVPQEPRFHDFAKIGEIVKKFDTSTTEAISKASLDAARFTSLETNQTSYGGSEAMKFTGTQVFESALKSVNIERSPTEQDSPLESTSGPSPIKTTAMTKKNGVFTKGRNPPFNVLKSWIAPLASIKRVLHKSDKPSFIRRFRNGMVKKMGAKNEAHEQT